MSKNVDFGKIDLQKKVYPEACKVTTRILVDIPKGAFQKV